MENALIYFETLMGQTIEFKGPWNWGYPLVICYIAIEAMAESKVREFSHYEL